MSRYYLTSTDEEVIQGYKAMKEMASARVKHFHELARSWGFDEIAMWEFGTPTSFFKLAETKDDEGMPRPYKGPAIPGFKGGDKYYQSSKVFYKYSFHGRNKLATQMQKEMKEGAPPCPEFPEGFGHRRDLDTAYCYSLGLPTAVFCGMAINYPVVHLLKLASGPVLVMSVPFNEDEDQGDLTPAVFPEGFEEVTERKIKHLVSEHNLRIEETKDE